MKQLRTATAKKKAIWLRKSRENKEDNDTLKTHRSVLVRMADDNNWDYDLYEEIIEGDAFKEELDRLLSNLEKYDGILCMDVDRLSRSKVEAFQLELEFANNKVKVITPNGTYDFADEGQNMMYSFKAVFAEAEHKKIKKRMKDGKINRFKNGEFSIGGKPAFGYRVVNKKLAIIEEEAEIVRQIFKMCIEGHGRQSIGEATGVSQSNVRWILDREVYIGNAKVNIYNSSGEVIDTLVQSCPAIIDVETFVKAQDEIKRREIYTSRTRGKLVSFIQGLCRCSVCGRQMVTARRTNAKSTLLMCNNAKCNNSGIKAEYVEKFVLDEIDDVLNVLNGVLADKLEISAPSTLPSEINSLIDQINALELKVNRIKDLYTDGDYTKEQYKEKKEVVDTELNHLKLKLNVLEVKQAENDNQTDVKEIKNLINDLHDFETKEMKQQNIILRRLIDKIEYKREIPKGKRRTKEGEYPPVIDVIYRTW